MKIKKGLGIFLMSCVATLLVLSLALIIPNATAAAETNGGQVYIGAQGSLEISGGTISGGNADYGGGVYLSEKATMTMTNGEISSNRATYGGAIAIEEGATATISGGRIRNNAGTYGGGIYNHGTLNITGGTFSGNTGGDIYNEGTLTLNGGSFSGSIYNNGTLNYYKTSSSLSLRLSQLFIIHARPSQTLRIELDTSLQNVGSIIARVDSSVQNFDVSCLNVTNLPVNSRLTLQNGLVVISNEMTAHIFSSGNGNEPFDRTYVIQGDERPEGTATEMDMYGVNVSCATININGYQTIIRPTDIYHSFDRWEVSSSGTGYEYNAIFRRLTLEEISKNSGFFYDEEFDGLNSIGIDPISDKYFLVGRTNNYFQNTSRDQQQFDEVLIWFINLKLFYPDEYDKYLKEFTNLGQYVEIYDFVNYINESKDKDEIHYEFVEVDETDDFLSYCHILLTEGARTEIYNNLFYYGDTENKHREQWITNTVIRENYQESMFLLIPADLSEYDGYDILGGNIFTKLSISPMAARIMGDTLDNRGIEYYVNDNYVELTGQHDDGSLAGGDIQGNGCDAFIGYDLESILLVADYLINSGIWNSVYIYSFDYLFNNGICCNFDYYDYDCVGGRVVSLLASTQRIIPEGFSAEVTLYDLVYTVIQDLLPYSEESQLFFGIDRSKDYKILNRYYGKLNFDCDNVHI